ncbi:MAG: SseB family protein [Actinobacteria bacterium]|nr:SseB family protein [Actinomycetota bacterium]
MRSSARPSTPDSSPWRRRWRWRVAEPALPPEVVSPLPTAPPRPRRSLPVSPFAGDDGARPAAFVAAKAVEPPERTPAVVRVMHGGRLLVPVLAHAHPGRTRAGAVVDHVKAAGLDPQQEACEQAATVTVDVADGRSAMPVFSSLAALMAWNPEARPVPVFGEQAARAAVTVSDGLMLLDPGDEPVLIPRPAVRALAMGEDWVPAWADEHLGSVAAAALGGIGELVGVRLEPGRTTEIRVVVAVRAGLDAPALRAALSRAADALSNDPVLRERVDSMELYPTSLA